MPRPASAKYRSIVRFAIALLLGASACSATRSNPNAEARTLIDLNSNWKFIRSDAPAAPSPQTDDSAWSAINLPHTWNNLDGQDGGNDYYRGVGWYRRHLALDPDPYARKSLYLKFDGASIKTDVFVNGSPAGPEHRNMFGAFCYDVTPLLKLGQDNLIAVRCDNSYDKNIPPLSADFTFFGGIYRGVHLLATHPLCISPIDDASPGVYITQKSVTPARALLEIKVELRNSGDTASAAIVERRILDADGKVVGSSAAPETIGPKTSGESEQGLVVDHPHLWNGRADPYLYRVVVLLRQNETIIDRVEQPLGVRFFQIDPNAGFILNGHPYPLHGVGRHQDRQDMGWAIGLPQHEEDFRLIMEMGCTFVRLAHYQQAQEVYDLCDRDGLIVWAEAALVNRVTPSREFDDNARGQLAELIKQSYNHPSICFWSLFNELGTNKHSLKPEELPIQADHQIVLAKALNSLAARLDPSRLTVAASHRDPDYPLHLIPDAIAFNRYDGWYKKSLADWPAELDSLHAALPGRGVAISEYGAGANIFQHEINPQEPSWAGPWHPEEYQSLFHEAAWGAMKNRPYLWMTDVWNMFDFAADKRNEGDRPGVNDKGLITYDRKIKKDAFYFYKANWSSDPFVYITSRRFTPRNFSDSPVKIYSNCDEVSLSLNGQSLGSRRSDNHIFIWKNVTLAKGSNLLFASGARDGKTYADSCTILFDPTLQFAPLTPALTQPTFRRGGEASQPSE